MEDVGGGRREDGDGCVSSGVMVWTSLALSSTPTRRPPSTSTSTSLPLSSSPSRNLLIETTSMSSSVPRGVVAHSTILHLSDGRSRGGGGGGGTQYGSVGGGGGASGGIPMSLSCGGGGGSGGSDLGLEKMRRRLRFFFMNPLEKWEAKRQFPYKLSIQLIKIFFVTFQLCLFASYRYASVNYTWDNKITFSHLFIKDWDTSREITSYPPTTGPLAVYTLDDFYDYVDYAVKRYGTVETVAIGPYFYANPNNSLGTVGVCVERYKDSVIFGFNESYVFTGITEKECIPIEADVIRPPSGAPFSSRDFFKEKDFAMGWDSLLETKVNFTLKTVRFRDLGPFKSPDCFQFDIDIIFNNRDHDGQALVTLEATPTRLRCKGDADYTADNRLERIGRSGINYIVIGLCTLSLVLCCRAIYRAQLLKAETVTFFKRYFGQDLCVSDRLEFLNFWYLLIIFNDILIIVGSALKEQIENKELTGEAWNICSLLLGIGNLLVWFGVLRYLGFFRTYNVLILTLRRASPSVLRFLLCALLIYAGFTFCGWLILGPYHIKFSSLSTTSETLFALINGDDMFATFAGLSTPTSPLLWWFARAYLYSFIALFIYVVLSLFIALIMDAYETIKLYYKDGFPRSQLRDFVADVDVLPPSTPPETSSLPSSLEDSLSQHTRAVSHNSHSHHQPPSSETTSLRRASTAGGILDTIVETICGVGGNNDTIKRDDEERDTERTPLLQVDL